MLPRVGMHWSDNVLTALCISLFVFCSYNVEIPVTSGFAVLQIPAASREVFRQHLDSFNDWSLVGVLCWLLITSKNTFRIAWTLAEYTEEY